MAYSYVVYTGNGATTQFTVPFPYIRREHVFASIDRVATTAFTWVNANTVQFNTAPGNGERVEIRRVTPVNAPLVDFTDGSTLVAADLDTNTLQQTYINQEQDDQIQDGIFINSQGSLDAGGKRITNVGNPTGAQDATTKNWVEGQDALKVSKTGDSMTGPLAMGSNKITGLGDPTNAQDATTKSWVETAAASPLQQFRSIFYGAYATDQATDPYGQPPTEGDLYFNTSLDQMRVYNGASWQEASADATITRFKFTAAGGETSLSGADDNAEVLTYNVGLELVYLNGALLTRGVDYVATTGSSITGLVALAAADLVEVVAFSQINALGSIPGANIADGTITEAKLASGAVTSSKIADGTITEAKLANGAVTSSKIADGTIVNADVSASAAIAASKLSFTQAGTGAAARTADSKLKDAVSVRDFGAAGNGSTNDTSAIQNAINAVAALGGGVVIFPLGVYAINSTITLGSGVTLDGGGSATIKATSSMTSMITASALDRIAVRGLTIDGDNNVTSYSVSLTTSTNVEVSRCRFINWTNGLRVASDTSTASKNVDVLFNSFTSPATSNAYYPLSVQSTTGGRMVENVRVIGNTIIGNPGAFSPSNNKTADQINLQGVSGFICTENVSVDGGEMGITVSRLSQNGIVSKNYVNNSDSHGINIGSGYFAARLSDSTGLSVNDSVTSATNSGWASTLQVNFTHDGSSDWWGFNSTTGGYLAVGSTVTNGTVTKTVQEVWYTRNIICEGNVIHDCASDASGLVPSSGIFIQQTFNISAIANLVNDDRSTRKTVYGIDARQSQGLYFASNQLDRVLTKDVILQGVTSVRPNSFFSDVYFNKTIITPKASNLLLSSNTNGEVTVSTSYARVDTASAASAGDLITINGGVDGARLTLQSASSARDVTLKDQASGGNLRLAGDFVLSHTDDTIELIYNGNISAWCEVSRSDNAA
jgi:hypothetical protein